MPLIVSDCPIIEQKGQTLSSARSLEVPWSTGSETQALAIKRKASIHIKQTTRIL